ncbi:hypothetical protein GCM10010472_27860 [Pseudonocardia halophobica]|uniref:Uncharacterized protein n=1 Tax=Pseudonocardia halophobica TaxID=29401 RepID=A0A9W6KXK4_9PSEU|nr:hypothetical protein GCM10017577_01850 [Pseudonocardia halophobica]
MASRCRLRPELATTGFHPLDGARYLVSADVLERLVGLVAMHSSAAAEAELFGVADQLAEFSDERTLTRDFLWWCDRTIGPDGQRMTFAERMDDVRAATPGSLRHSSPRPRNG